MIYYTLIQCFTTVYEVAVVYVALVVETTALASSHLKYINKCNKKYTIAVILCCYTCAVSHTLRGVHPISDDMGARICVIAQEELRHERCEGMCMSVHHWLVVLTQTRHAFTSHTSEVILHRRHQVMSTKEKDKAQMPCLRHFTLQIHFVLGQLAVWAGI